MKQRRFAAIGEESELRSLFKELVDNLRSTHDNIVDQRTNLPNQMAALCWAIAVDAVLLAERRGIVFQRELRGHAAEIGMQK